MLHTILTNPATIPTIRAKFDNVKNPIIIDPSEMVVRLWLWLVNRFRNTRCII